ncbi:MAG TPA: PP2C family protein-serine/threonine phosphatase [Cyclobacteriaceae bacterium]|nr:PP2C family protein-serine/threonine phosphatase [Cyclobacteriaceae bacterium]
MPAVDFRKKFEKKELELNSLLEITRAINNNTDEDVLYRIYHFTLLGYLQKRKLALYVFEEKWSCKVYFNTEQSYKQQELDERFTGIKEVKRCADFPLCKFTEFDYAIPVVYNGATKALVYLGGISDDNNGASAEETIKFIQAVSNIFVVAIENKKLVRRQIQQEALRKELEIASDVQQFLFPTGLPNTERLKIEASYLPHDVVGGDYYDYIPINKNQFLVCVADVSGKGIPAALMMSNFQASLRTLVRQTPNLTEIVEALNFQVLDNAKGEKFITAFLGIYDISLKTLVYINAGHNAPILWDPKHGIRLLEDGTTVLGAVQPMPFINEGFITELDNFLLFCYTDGLIETLSEAENEFGMDSLISYFEQNHSKDLKVIHQDIIVDLDTFKGRNAYRDDITMLSCRFKS